MYDVIYSYVWNVYAINNNDMHDHNNKFIYIAN